MGSFAATILAFFQKRLDFHCAFVLLHNVRHIIALYAIMPFFTSLPPRYYGTNQHLHP